MKNQTIKLCNKCSLKHKCYFVNSSYLKDIISTDFSTLENCVYFNKFECDNNCKLCNANMCIDKIATKCYEIISKDWCRVNDVKFGDSSNCVTIKLLRDFIKDYENNRRVQNEF